MTDLTPSPISDNAERILKARYYRKDNDGNPTEDWASMVKRVVQYVCGDLEAEQYKQEIFQEIYKTRFLPNSPCLVNAGTPLSGLSACFVIPNDEDSWSGMVKTIYTFGEVARKGGGCGTTFSHLRPRGFSVAGSTHNKACGACEHLRLVSEAMATISQGGFRGMANMGTLSVYHPEILDFIDLKQRDRALKTYLKEDIFNHYTELKNSIGPDVGLLLDKFISNFNISIVVDDAFMQKVQDDQEYELSFGGKTYGTLRAREVLQKIAQNAWTNGDPGLLFGTAINEGPYKYSGQAIEACNPCGEQILPPNGVCNLGSIDVSKFYQEDRFSWVELANTITLAVRFLDDVVTTSTYPTNDITVWSIKNRPIGLGVMGFADLLLKMELAYGSEDSIAFAKKLMKFIYDKAHEISVQLGKERGTPESCTYLELENRRNVTVVSIAPTGSISLLADCSSGIEPIFSPTVFRYDNTGACEMPHPMAGKKYFRSAINKDQPEKEVTWEQHIEIQAAFQRYVDSGVSKTINMSKTATVEDVYQAYLQAWKSGNKGITCYRDGSKLVQVLNTSRKKNLGDNFPEERPKTLKAKVFHSNANGLSWNIFIGILNGLPYEIFAMESQQTLPEEVEITRVRKRHYQVDFGEEVLVENLLDNRHPSVDLETRRFSMELRHHIPAKIIVDQIDKSDETIASFSKAVSRIFKTKFMTDEDLLDLNSGTCSKCGSANVELQVQEGCVKIMCREPECLNYDSKCK